MIGCKEDHMTITWMLLLLVSVWNYFLFFLWRMNSVKKVDLIDTFTVIMVISWLFSCYFCYCLVIFYNNYWSLKVQKWGSFLVDRTNNVSDIFFEINDAENLSKNGHMKLCLWLYFLNLTYFTYLKLRLPSNLSAR